MPLIIIVTIIVFLILIAWTWQSLGQIDKSKKVLFILIGIVIMYICTLIVFNISKSGISYQNIESQKVIQNILVAVFTGINGIIIMPFIAKIAEKLDQGEIEKEQATKRIFTILVVFLIVLIFECGYLKDTQEGILRVYKSLAK